jgi:saccharopine dehydrogenase (NAD+, L-lysine-forming)
MEKTLKIGILRETKNPPDRRVPLTPPQIIALQELYPQLEFYIQPSDIRCYSDEEYEYLNIPLKENLSNCDILMGIKEIDKRTIIQKKAYLFFAQIGKGQLFNRELLNEFMINGVRLIDYEYLKNEKGQRVAAFGRWAGIVGAYNALRARGIKTNKFKLKPAHQCKDIEEMWAGLHLIQLKAGLKILITGEGRVAKGAMETFDKCSLVQISIEDYLSKEFDVPVICQIGPKDYTQHRSGQPFIFKHFLDHPEEYESTFLPFSKVTDILVTGHYWNPKSPEFFTRDAMKKKDFRISIVADISCDINGPIPSTIRSTTISDPFYSYNPHFDREEPAFTNSSNIIVMSIGNLASELPRDSSYDFGNQLMENIIHQLVTGDKSGMIERATITKSGKIAPSFSYLNEYLK